MRVTDAATSFTRPVRDPDVPSVAMLTQAQDLADHLRREAQAELEQARAEAARVRADNEEAIRNGALRRAELENMLSARLDAVLQTSMTHLEEAAAQAARVADNAQRAANEAFAAAKAQADELVANALAEAAEVRQRADAMLRAADDRLQGMIAKAAAELGGREVTLLESESRWRSALEREANSLVARVSQEGNRVAEDTAEEVRTAIADIRNGARTEVEAARAEVEAGLHLLLSERNEVDRVARELRGTLAIERTEALSELQREADRMLDESLERLALTRVAMKDLLLDAAGEADKMRRDTADELEGHAVEVRAKLQDILDRGAEEARRRQEEVAATVVAAEAEAVARLEVAQKEAEETLRSAEEQAAQVLADSSEQATRRLAEADKTARTIRERAAEDLEVMQRDFHERNRLVREEAMALLAESRRDADEARAEAHDMLERARAEVAELSRRRQEIQLELGHLSGVIEALAINESDFTADSGDETAQTGWQE